MSTSVMQLQPKSIGREFVRRYYTILNRSPENLHCFYNDEATFIHDDIDPMVQKTISVVGKQAIRDVMNLRALHYRHNCTIINGIDTVATINNGLVVQVFGEIAHNGEHMRPFSQSFVLMAVSSLKYYVLNEIFRFRDFVPAVKRPMSETEPIEESAKTTNELNATFMEDENEVTADDDEDDDDQCDKNNVTVETSVEEIIEMQSKHLKSILQEAQHKGGNSSNYRKQIESAVTVAAVAPMKQISNEMAKQLFQDNCIITIGSVINPNIKFNDEKTNDSEPTSSNESEPNVDIQTKSCVEQQSKSKQKISTKTSIELQSKTNVDSQPKNCSSEKDSPEPKEASDQNEDNKTMEESEKAVDAIEVLEAPAEVVKDEEKTPNTIESAEIKPKSYAELLKLAREKSRSASSSSRSSSVDLQSGSFSCPKDKPLIIRNSTRRKNDKQSPPNRDHRSRSDNVLQVFIGNIIQSASEDDLRRMFGKFGTISRFRMHSNPEKCWLPHYAFVTYENIDAVRRCLAKRNSLYYPENAPNRLKLNVNGDESIVLSDEEMPKVNVTKAENTSASNQQSKRRRELKQFQTDFQISTSTRDTSGPVDKKIDAKSAKSVIESQPMKLHQLECERIHGGRNQIRHIAGKA